MSGRSGNSGSTPGLGSITLLSGPRWVHNAPFGQSADLPPPYGSRCETKLTTRQWSVLVAGNQMSSGFLRPSERLRHFRRSISDGEARHPAHNSAASAGWDCYSVRDPAQRTPGLHAPSNGEREEQARCRSVEANSFPAESRRSDPSTSVWCWAAIPRRRQYLFLAR
jgi:hypothetical protein